jgi:hypothetical protein
MSYACLPKTKQMERNGKSINVVAGLLFGFCRLPLPPKVDLFGEKRQETSSPLAFAKKQKIKNHRTLIDRVSLTLYGFCETEEDLPVFVFQL